MDNICENNYVQLLGVMAARPEFSHSYRGRRYCVFPLEVMRLSGNTDTINILVAYEQLQAVELSEGEKLQITGELRSYNNRRGEGAKLIISVLARDILLCDGEDSNSVYLRGTLCKAPNLRSTPSGRDICDLMVAVNRRYGRSDYLPCICWGVKAHEAAQWGVGDRISLTGRIQSRRYIKLSDDGPIERTAYEISATEAVIIDS